MCVRGILYMKWVMFRTGKFTLLYLADKCQNWFDLKFSTDSLKLLKTCITFIEIDQPPEVMSLCCCWWSCMAGIHSAIENYSPLWVQGNGSRWIDKEHAEKIKKLKLDTPTSEHDRFMPFKASIQWDSWHFCHQDCLEEIVHSGCPANEPDSLVMRSAHTTLEGLNPGSLAFGNPDPPSACDILVLSAGFRASHQTAASEKKGRDVTVGGSWVWGSKPSLLWPATKDNLLQSSIKMPQDLDLVQKKYDWSIFRDMLLGLLGCPQYWH